MKNIFYLKLDNLYNENDISDLYKSKEYYKCLELCDAIIKTDPDNDTANNYKAICLLHLGYYGEAIKVYNKLITTNINFSHYVFRGDCYYKLAQYDNALQDFIKALDMEPKTGGVWQRVAETYFMMGDFEEAHVNIDRAIKMSNKNFDTWAMKAVFYKFQGKDIEASRMFSEIRKVYPNNELIIDQQFEILAKTFDNNKNITSI